MVPRRIWLLVGVLALAAGVLFVLRPKRPPPEQPVAGPSPHDASRAGDVRLDRYVHLGKAGKVGLQMCDELGFDLLP